MVLKDKSELSGLLTGFPEELSNRLCSITGYVDYSCAVSCIPVFKIGISLATLSRSVICCALAILGTK
jgi:hypothetical protein